MNPLFGEQKFKKAPDCFGGVALPPVSGADPIADLAGVPCFVKEIDDPDESARLFFKRRANRSGLPG